MKLFDIIFQVFPCAVAGGGVGLGVRFLSNHIWWGGSLHLGEHFCCGVVHGTWKLLDYSESMCHTSAGIFDLASISCHNTMQKSPPCACLPFLAFVLFYKVV